MFGGGEKMGVKIPWCVKYLIRLYLIFHLYVERK